MREATQSRLPRVRVSHVATEAIDSIHHLGLDVSRDDLELTLKPQSALSADETKALLRVALKTILDLK